MEPINTNADNSEDQQIIGDQFEEGFQDFYKFRQKISQSSLSDDMKLEDLIDLYITNSSENSYNTSQPTENHLPALTDNSEILQVIDNDKLEKFIQEFNEIREKIPQSSSSGEMRFEDLIDLYITNSGYNTYSSTSQPTDEQFTAIFEDLNEYESNLPSNQVEESPRTNGSSNIDATEIEEIEMIINEIWGNSDTCYNNEGISGKKVTHIRYGEIDGPDIFSSVLGGGNDMVSGSVIKYFKRLMNFSKGNIRRKRVKRKYTRRVIQTEENREGAAAE